MPAACQIPKCPGTGFSNLMTDPWHPSGSQPPCPPFFAPCSLAVKYQPHGNKVFSISMTSPAGGATAEHRATPSQLSTPTPDHCLTPAVVGWYRRERRLGLYCAVALIFNSLDLSCLAGKKNMATSLLLEGNLLRRFYVMPKAWPFTFTDKLPAAFVLHKDGT